MRSLSVMSATLVVALSVASLSLAQERPEGPGRGRGGPPGGGMFFGGGGFRANRMFLLALPEVRKELELADEQVAEIEKLAEELRAKYPSPFGGRGGEGGRDGGRRGRGPDNNDRGAIEAPAAWYFVQAQQPQGQPPQGQGRRGFGGGQPPSPEERARFEQQRLERTREEKARLSEILLPEQLQRLNEIYIQQLGIGALDDEDVAKALGIGESQKAKIAEVRQQNDESFRSAMREMFQGGGGGGGGNFEANRGKIEELRKANDAKVLAVLSADQQRKFEAMKGKPFQMPEGPGRGGPGGFGGRSRGPGNNN